MVIVAQGPSEGVKHITKEEAIAVLDKVESSNLEPYKDQVTEASLINEDLKGSKIIATKKLPQFDAEEWTLENGAKSGIPQSRLRKRPSTSKFLQ